MRAALVALALAAAPLGAAADCPAVPEPVVALGFDSRYAGSDDTRSDIDPEAEAEAEAALAPLDAFISDLAQRTDMAVRDADGAAAGCVLSALAAWARADALAEQGTETAKLTIGARLAALALIAGRVAPATESEDLAAVRDWLARRVEEQMRFWETAPDGARRGNLRAWAGLAAAATALLTQDAVTRGWAAWSLAYVACTADADGSLPQEMARGKRALHYQLHAVAPLTVGAAVLRRQGIDLTARCDRALDRIVAFTLADVTAGGTASAALTGEPQTVSGGPGALKDFQLAWGPAWLRLRADPALAALLTSREGLKYSKLGGDQRLIWAP